MTHARVSPDHEWIAFTRYHDRGWDGLATEDRGYAGTEIVIVRMDGSNEATVVASKDGFINSNPSWVDGGKALMWVSTDTAERSPQIWKIDLSTRARVRVPTPIDLATTDPDLVGNRLVFPVKRENEFDTIYSMNVDGTDVKPISRPTFPADISKGKLPLGDYDPKLSPDGTKVAFMRLFGETGWRVFVLSIATGEERDLTGPGRIDGLPEWSSNGELLIFRHINLEKMDETGIYTMKPDGTDRRMVPLPRGYLHNHAQFWPGTGSDSSARIVYVARRYPGVP